MNLENKIKLPLTDVLKDGKGRILKPLKLNANPTFNPDVEVTKKKTHSEDGMSLYLYTSD